MKPQYQQYTKQLIKVCSDQGYSMRPLGLVGDKPIWFIDQSTAKGPRLLIVAGFHGEEKAGPWGVLEWIREGKEVEAHVSFIPVVNPTAFNLGKRYNTWGEKSNCGFFHNKGKPSEEGKILLAHKELLIYSSIHGCLSLHEDIDSMAYYLYTFEHTKDPGKFTCGLLDELSKHFDKPLNGQTTNNDPGDPGPYVVNGLVYKHCDGSFEDWMFHEGAAQTAVTETPAYRTRLQRRVKASVAVIDRFIDLCVEA